MDFGRALWLARWQRLRRYPRFYKSVGATKLSFDELESEVQFQCWTNALEQGALARLSCPLLQSPLYLKASALPGPTAPLPSDQPGQGLTWFLLSPVGLTLSCCSEPGPQHSPAAGGPPARGTGRLPCDPPVPG